jgi:cellulose synthase/poly-beta-1,6-N-acetylglucosamine synthase-like glycosyltransferase
MPFLNETPNLPVTLASLAAQTVPRERIFVIGVDNASVDGSGELVRAWLAEHGVAGVVVVEPARSIPRALNTGLRLARAGDVVVRIDAHTRYAPDYLAAIAAAFARLPADVWCVGGAPTPPEPDSFTSGLLNALYTNPLGLGPADFRARLAEPKAVDHVYLGAWRPGVLESLGGFDTRWLANEDSELSARIIEAGGRVFRIDARCLRKETRGLAGTVRQWSRYGFWRAQTLKRHPQMTRPRHLAPPIALTGFVALLCSPWRALALAAYALYAAATIAKRRPGERAAVTAGALVFFPAVHVGYALGLLRGAIRKPATFQGGDGSEGAKTVGDISLCD